MLLALLDGEASVDDIIKRTGLTSDVVRYNIKALVETHVVDEVKSSLGTAGRHPSTYRLNQDTFDRML